MTAPKHISLFTGAGGLDIGLEQAGFETRATVEIDDRCRETLAANRDDFAFPPFASLSDITQLSPYDILLASGIASGEVDLVSGGPPCQPFSTAGKRMSAQDDRGGLFQDFVRVIGELQPRFFVMENVRGLLSAAIRHRPIRQRGKSHPPLEVDERLGSFFNRIVIPAFVSRCGYQVVYGVISSLDYGVAQDRKRLIIIGSRDREFWFPGSVSKEIKTIVPSTHNLDGQGGLAKYQTLGDALEGLPPGEPEYIAYSAARADVLNKIPAGHNWRYIRDNYSDKYLREIMGGAYASSGGRVGFYRRLSFDKWAPTLMANPMHKGTCLCHPEETRPLSIAEYARIQGFPDHWIFKGTTRDKYRQIGNAVPVGLARNIGKAIADFI